jgi:hypothetical protein
VAVVSVTGSRTVRSPEVGDQIQAAAERFDVAGDDLEGGHLAVLDLGDAGDAYPERRGYIFLCHAELLAGLGELVAPVLGEQPVRSCLDLLGRYARRVEFLFQGFPVLRGCASAWSFLFVGGVVDVELFG